MSKQQNEALTALASDSWDDVCHALDILLAEGSNAVWARLAEGVSYSDGAVTIADNSEISRIMGSPIVRFGSDDESIQRLRHVVVGLHALFNGCVEQVQELRLELVDDLLPLLRLPFITKLDVRGYDVDMEPLGRMAALQHLSVRRFSGLYEDPGLKFIRTLPHLKSLYIDLACGTGAPSCLGGIEILREHPTIEHLSLDWCDIQEDDLEIIASIPQLHSLDLWYADNLEDYSLIRGMTSLQRLTLDIGGRNYGGLSCLAHLFERGGLEFTDEDPLGVTSAVDLSPLTALTPASVTELEHCRQSLVLNGLREVSDDTMQRLANSGRNLYLDQLETLHKDSAEILSNHSGYLSLRGLRHIEKEAAELMAGRQSWFTMSLPDSLDQQTQLTLRGNCWYIPLEECQWQISNQSFDHWQVLLATDNNKRTSYSAETLREVQSLLKSGEKDAASEAIVSMTQANAGCWQIVFDSETMGILADSWNPRLWRQFCELCPCAEMLQEFIVATSRRLAAKSLDFYEPDEHIDLYETFDCTDTPSYLREILELQMTASQNNGSQEHCELAVNEATISRAQRRRPFFL